MTSLPAIRAIAFDTLQVTPATRWAFVRLTDDEGRVGAGEASLGDQAEALAAEASRLLPALLGMPAGSDTTACLPEATHIAASAIRSAADMALLDLEGQRCRRPVAALLGPVQRQSVPLYANINRRSRARTPESFVQSARLALDLGFTILKMAPFDEVTPERCHAGDGVALMQAGLRRIAAVREAIGAERTLRVDCHWRFDAATAGRLVDAVAPLALDWLECPLPEEAGTIADIAAIRAHASRYGMRLAGLEQGIGLDDFRPFLQAGAYDVIMPDVKYLGGLRRFLDLGALAERHGAILSPHNPTGPICHAASLHVSAVLPKLDSLEMQLDETPLFDALVGGPCGSISAGRSTLPSGGNGLGACLDAGLVAQWRIAGLSRSFG